MAEFTEVMKQKKRMCKAMVSCNKCQMSSMNNKKGKLCHDFMVDYSQEAEAVIMKWAEEHPVVTNADKFKEVFGYKLDFYTIEGCVNNCILECRESSECKECSKYNFWEQEYKEPKEVE